MMERRRVALNESFPLGGGLTALALRRARQGPLYLEGEEPAVAERHAVGQGPALPCRGVDPGFAILERARACARRGRRPRSPIGADCQKRTGPHEGARWFSMPLWGTAPSSRGEHAGADAKSGRTTASASHARIYADGAVMRQCMQPHDCHAAKFPLPA